MVTQSLTSPTMPRLRHHQHLMLLSLLPLISARVSLQDVQAIVGFPDSCMDAYAAPLSSCTADMFRGNGGTGQCSQDCFNQLSDLTGTIQSACAGQKASGGTLIGHFFVGDANTFLCGFDTGSGTDTTTAAATTTTSVSETAAASTSTTEESSTTTEESSSSSSTKSKTTESTSTSTSTKVTTTTLQTSTTSTETSSTSTSSSTSTVASAGQSTSTQQIGITGGGSPFDIALPAAALSARGSLSVSMLLGSVIAAVMLGQ